MLSPQKKEELKKNWLRFHNRSLYEPEQYADYWLSKFDQLLDEELSSYTQEIREKVKKLLNDKRFPHQSLLFQDCPDCGQEINREWVDNKCKEIRDEALKDVLQILESNE